MTLAQLHYLGQEERKANEPEEHKPKGSPQDLRAFASKAKRRAV